VGLAVLGAKERLLPPIPPLGDVVRETRGDYPSNARHGASALFPYSRSGVQYGVPGIGVPGIRLRRQVYAVR